MTLSSILEDVENVQLGMPVMRNTISRIIYQKYIRIEDKLRNIHSYHLEQFLNDIGIQASSVHTVYRLLCAGGYSTTDLVARIRPNNCRQFGLNVGQRLTLLTGAIMVRQAYLANPVG